MVKRFVVPLRRYEDNPIMVKDPPLEGPGTGASRAGYADPAL